ncbi:MAG: penicillin-binding protein 2 [Candidatus Eremiobacteraeota bacterium]|nr:penicillin-binding protein 2 [Candidatus Eremiobacteraeota bacterium]
MHQRTFARIGPRRAKAVFYVMLAIGVYLMWRLVDVQVLKGPVFAKEALAQRSDTVDVFARRGSIMDRDGNVLVRSLPSESVYAVPHDLSDPDKTVTQLERVLGKVDAQTAAALHDKRLQFYWIARKIAHDEAERVQSLEIPGIAVIQEDTGRRVDVAGTSASTLVGFVGIDENGLDGIEYSYDSLLKGTSGKITFEEDQFGHPLPFAHQKVLKPAKPGLSLQLTIDSYLQYVTESALAKQVKTYHARSGTAIVMDPYSGEVLAVANYPTFDPNAYWKYPLDARRDRAVLDSYEPGSTYKLVTAAAALESGRVTQASRFPSHDTIEVGGRTIHNAEDGFIASNSTSESLEDIIAYSHNVGAAEVGLTIGGRRFYSMEQRAGFGLPTKIGVSGENPGIVPAPKDWSGSSLATMAFGQGVSVTPIAMTRFYAAIANGGLLMRPRIVHAIYDGDGNEVYAYPPEIERRVFSVRTARELRKYLRSVVVRGTGNPTAQIPGYTTAGKTGTAQIVANGGYEPGAYTASFIGMIPYEHPRYIIYVKVERPVGAIYGGVVAAPAFVEIARSAMMHNGVLPSPVPAPSSGSRSSAIAHSVDVKRLVPPKHGPKH